MLHRLDKYLLSQFFTVLSISLLGFLAVFLVVDLIENLDRFVDNGVPIMVTITYYIYTIPWFISVALPMSMLMSTVFSIGVMVKRNEWTAMKSTGISLYRLSAPLLLVGMIISILSFLLDNQLVSYGNKKRYTIDRDYLKKKSRHKIKSSLKNIFLQKDISIHIGIEKYNVKKMSGDVLTWVDLGTDLIRQRIDAKKIAFEKFFRPRDGLGQRREEMLASWLTTRRSSLVDWKRDGNLIRKGKPNKPRPGSSKNIPIGQTRITGEDKILRDWKRLLKSWKMLADADKRSLKKDIRSAARSITTKVY